MQYIKDRLREGPTWAGIVALLSLLLSGAFPESKEFITEVGTALTGLILALLPNKIGTPNA